MSIMSEVESRIGGWVLYHSRQSDVVLIGPFSSFQDALSWWEQIGRDNGVSFNPTSLRFPTVNRDNSYSLLWGPLEEKDFEVLQEST